jgi:hypothetical protein
MSDSGSYDPGSLPSELGGTMADWTGGGDTAPAGAGGDPYAGAPPDSSTPETFDTGTLPGGPDAQLTPFSPQGGFDFTNVLQGAGGLFGRRASPWRASMSSSWDIGSAATAPNLGTTAPAGAPESMLTGDIVRWVRAATGLRVSAASIVGLIVRYGFQAAAALTKLDFPSLLQLFMQAKGVRHHRRGPGLYTIARKLRAADRLRDTCRRILGGGHTGYHRAARARRAPYHHFRRKKKR